MVEVRQGTLGAGWSWLRSGREHWAWVVVVEVRQRTLWIAGRSWSQDDEDDEDDKDDKDDKEDEEEEEERRTRQEEAEEEEKEEEGGNWT